MALRIKGQGSRAINLRSSFGTLRDDVRLVELVRHAVGDDFHILTDGNEAPGNADAGGYDPTLIHEPPIGDIFTGWSIFENAPALGKDGYITLPQGPGLGVTVRPDLIERT